MYLKITFADHPDSLVEVSAGHTFQILGADGAVTAAFAFDGVSDITLHAEQLAPQPVPAPPAEAPAPDAPAPDAAPADPVADPAHDQAVADAQQAVTDATAAVTDPSLPTPAVVDHLAAALADIRAALVLYPDSSELADAKAQLDDLAAQVTPAV